MGYGRRPWETLCTRQHCTCGERVVEAERVANSQDLLPYPERPGAAQLHWAEQRWRSVDVEDAQVLGAVSADQSPVKGLVEAILPCTHQAAGLELAASNLNACCRCSLTW